MPINVAKNFWFWTRTKRFLETSTTALFYGFFNTNFFMGSIIRPIYGRWIFTVSRRFSKKTQHRNNYNDSNNCVKNSPHSKSGGRRGGISWGGYGVWVLALGSVEPGRGDGCPGCGGFCTARIYDTRLFLHERLEQSPKSHGCGIRPVWAIKDCEGPLRAIKDK